MTRKNYMCVILAIVLALCFLGGVTYYGAAQAFDRETMKNGEEMLERTAARTGYVNLGIVDEQAVYKKAGVLYSGQALMEELFGRNGLPVPTNSWMEIVTEEGYITVIKITEFEGEETEPIFDQKVKQIYLAGLY